MKRQNILELGVFALIVTLGFAVRVILQDLPNFAPVAAIALFAGFYFRNRVLALCAPLAVMVSSDMIIGGYQWYVMAAVYGMLALPVLMGGALRTVKSPGKLALGLGGCTLAGSLMFFAVTNFAAWFSLGYALTPVGLAQCYASAIPFFRFTLAGDFAFAVVLFGSYALAQSLARVEEPCTQA